MKESGTVWGLGRRLVLTMHVPLPFSLKVLCAKVVVEISVYMPRACMSTLPIVPYWLGQGFRLCESPQ